MAFEAHIREISHEGGLLAPFTGDAPKLGQIMQLPGGKWIGKVDTVIGEISAAVVHITPFRDVDCKLLIGQPVEFAPPKEKKNQREHRNNSNMKEGDWTCSKCKNHNFAWRDNCNRCEAPKTGGGGNGRQRRDSRGGDRRDNNRGGGQRRDYRGGDRRDNNRGGGQRRDNRGGERRDNNRGGDQRRDNSRPPRTQNRGERRPVRRDTKKSGGWGPKKGKGGPRRR